MPASAPAVTKRFGDTVAVEDLDLEIEPGEFFSILGPSGCGKTTTLRMLAGFEQPTRAIFLEGELVERVPPYRRNVNTVFQSYALFEHLYVRTTSRSGCAPEGPGARSTRGWRRRSSWCSCAAASTARRASSPAASSSAWRWRARW